MNNIEVEDAVFEANWELTRNDEIRQLNGGMLAIIVSIALESGWTFPSVVKPSSSRIDLELLRQLPEHFSDQQAHLFSEAALRLLSTQDQGSLGTEGSETLELLQFIHAGAFELKRRRPRLNCLILNVPD